MASGGGPIIQAVAEMQKVMQAGGSRAVPPPSLPAGSGPLGMTSLERGSIGGSRGPSLHHFCFLRTWIGARHRTHSVNIGGLPESPADIRLRRSPLRFHSEEALGRDGQGLSPLAFSCN